MVKICFLIVCILIAALNIVGTNSQAVNCNNVCTNVTETFPTLCKKNCKVVSCQNEDPLRYCVNCNNGAFTYCSHDSFSTGLNTRTFFSINLMILLLIAQLLTIF